jgi:hypothetical protein
MKMRVAKSVLTAVVICAVVAYVFDCSAMSTPEEAMQCCDSMPCSSHGRSQAQDCCKTMASMHALFVQPSSGQRFSSSPDVLAVLPASVESQYLVLSVHLIQQQQFRAPPVLSTASLPLRI